MTADSAKIELAARQLRAGRLVAFPTETVYGLGANATSPEAVACIYAAKGRPRFNPLIAHVASLDAALAEGRFPTPALTLAERFWPGPLTIVVPRTATGHVCDLACAGLSSIGLRVPAHPVALELLKAAGTPIAAPSANRSGRLSPTSPADVATDLGDAIDFVLDGGLCAIGLESTIVAMLNEEAVLLRPGGIEREAIEAALGRPLVEAGAAITAPGMLASHYAPRAQLRLGAVHIERGEVGLGFAGRPHGAALDLSAAGNLAEAAANLYRHLRALDRDGPRCIAVAPIPEVGLGAAINDRLRRAAAPRPAT